jgi:hypothetical protein
MHCQAQPIKEYIKEHYGTQLKFAARLGVQPAQITQWIRSGFVVIDHKLYTNSPREFIVFNDKLYLRDERNRDLRPLSVNRQATRTRVGY